MARLFSTAGRQADLLLAVALVLVTTNFRIVLSSPTLAGQINLLDHSWAFDFVVKAQQHIWLGDKVTFTYGPLFQLASAEIVNAFGGSLGAYLRTAHLLPSWAGIVLTFLTGRILLAGHPLWKRSFYLLVLVGFWGVLDVRFCFNFFSFAVALRYFDRLSEAKVLRWKSAITLAFILLIGFLISADTGMYAVAAFGIAGLAHFLVFRTDASARRTIVLGAAAACVAFLLLAVLTAAVMPHSGFGFWINSLETVSHYRWSLAFAMDKPVKWRLIGATAISMLVLMAAYRWRDPRSHSLVRRPAFFPAAIAFSLLTLQSAIVRSDWGHVFLAMLPNLALAGAVLMGGTRTAKWKWRSDIPPFAAFALTVVFSGPIAALQPKTIVAGFRPPITQSRTCPPGMFLIDDACLTRRSYEPLSAVSEYLRTHTAENEAVAIFPFENMYAAVARRPVAGGVLQNYQIAGERLSRLQLDGLERDRPRLAVYSADGLATVGVDGVPNLTRTPEVWLYLQRHFRKQAELAPGVAILARDEARAKRWKSEAANLGTSVESGIRLKQATPVPLLHWPDDCDLLRLRLRVSYPSWWRVTKPAALSVIIGLADNSEKTIRAVVPPNEIADLWIYPWDEAQLLRYFDQ
ncbi:MAG: hypothetical protein L0Z53_27150, partial [Acidobacteriales bacterium]|nr:hypothetical protein [Terriglobales bacterium]